MRELAIAAVWLSLAIGLFAVEPDLPGNAPPFVKLFVHNGKWAAAALAVINALRPLLKYGIMALLRKLGLAPDATKVVEAPPPVNPVVVHPEFHVDDRIKKVDDGT